MRPLLFLLLMSLSLPCAGAQQLPSNLSEIRSWIDHVKVEGDRTERRTVVVAIDYATGQTEQLFYDAEGTLLHQEITGYAAPNARERERAIRMIKQDAELGPLATQLGVIVEGGFPLLRRAGEACGPGSRCLQFDMYRSMGSRSATRIRYVVVDLAAGIIVNRDLEPSESGNIQLPLDRAEGTRD
ncbi:hypothetical protein BH23BAC4_BH23BAC4_06540 [soil metagenome]